MAPHILLVDNDPHWLRAEQQHLSALGYAVTVADTEEEAEQRFREADFDLVVLDLMMERKDAGIVLAHHFKKARPRVPILLVTDLTSETGMVFRLASSGERRWIQADRILPKPVRLDRLTFEAEQLLGEKSLATSGQQHHAAEEGEL
jgi:two-component system OmpR family response regulator